MDDHDVKLFALLERAVTALERIAQDSPLHVSAPLQRAETMPPKTPAAPRAHVPHPRTDDLFHCAVCGGAEGSLTTECFGERMAPGFEDRVYKGEIDYVGGEWRPGTLMQKLARSSTVRDNHARSMPRPTIPQEVMSASASASSGPVPTTPSAEAPVAASAPSTETPTQRFVVPSPSSAAGQFPDPAASNLAVLLQADIARGERLVAAVGRDMGGRLALLPDASEAPRDLCQKVKALVLETFGEDGFVTLRTRIGVKPGAIPTGEQLRAFALALGAPQETTK